MNIVRVFSGKFNIKFSLKVKTKRPTSIKVNYLNQHGEEVDQILQGFPARVFCHEYEHILGIPFIDWKVSLGEIEVIQGLENNYENLIQVKSL